MTQLFGKVYEELGSNTSDLLLKTRSLVLVQQGNLFIDLLNLANSGGGLELPSGCVFLCKKGSYDTQLFEPCEDLKDIEINNYIYVKKK